jgi:hypothetical protein
MSTYRSFEIAPQANASSVVRVGILFTPRIMDSPEPPKVFTDFWTLAYEAME